LNCPKCGAALSQDAKFCGKCGFALVNGQNQPTNYNSSPETYNKSPPGFTKGSFPRQHIITGETIHWEGKPALISFIIPPSILFILSILVILILPFFGIFLMIIALIGLAVSYLRWKKTSFAITNRRILCQYGILTTKFADCPHDKIQNSVVIKPFIQNLLGYGDLMFATAGFRGGINTGSANKMMANGGGILWNGLPHPDEVKRFAEEVIEMSKSQAKMNEYETMMRLMNDGRTVVSQQYIQPNQSIDQRLAKAKQMRDNNIVTQEEYEEIRKKILLEV
jgi:hypothetical protein